MTMIDTTTSKIRDFLRSRSDRFTVKDVLAYLFGPGPYTEEQIGQVFTELSELDCRRSGAPKDMLAYIFGRSGGASAVEPTTSARSEIPGSTSLGPSDVPRPGGAAASDGRLTDAVS